jgi:hypothetical protein
VGDHFLLSNGGALVRHQLQVMLELLHACLVDGHENVWVSCVVLVEVRQQDAVTP